MGFSLDISEKFNLAAGGIPKDKKASLFEWLGSFCKTLSVPISLWTKSFSEGFTNYEPPCYLDNLFNANMNNALAIDFANKNAIADHDGVLTRHTSEYPRISTQFRVKSDR